MTESETIVEWVSDGNLNFFEGPTSVPDLVEYLSGIADDCCLAEITGSNLFKAADGKYYTVVTEILIEEASPEFVTEMLEEKRESEEQNDC